MSHVSLSKDPRLACQHIGAHANERQLEIGECGVVQPLIHHPFQLAEGNEPVATEPGAGQMQPVDAIRHLGDLPHRFARRNGSANHSASTGSSHRVNAHTRFLQHLQRADMRQPEGRAAAEDEAEAFGLGR